MKKNNETSMVKTILEAGNALGFFKRNNTGVGSYSGGNGKTRYVAFGSVGSADIEGIINGYHVSIELKSEKGKQTKKQIEYEYKVLRSGGYYFVVRSIKEGIDAIRGVWEETGKNGACRPLHVKLGLDSCKRRAASGRSVSFVGD